MGKKRVTIMVEKVCGNCARFKVPDSGCTYTKYIREGIITPSDKACDNFYPRPEKEKKKGKLLYKDSGLAEEGHFEAIYRNDKPAFLVVNIGNFKVLETITCNDQTYYPKDTKRIPYEPYGYFPGAVPNREELFWKVRNEFRSFIDVEDIYRDIWASCVLLSYHQEKLQTVPYVFVYGDNESGKSTVLQVFKTLCYRPLYGVTVPAADIYGYLDDIDSIGTLLEDEIQGINKDFDKVKIYKAGYKQGAVVPRTLITQHDRIIKFYNTFCFKACASERIPLVKGFRERFLETPMIEGFPIKEWADINEEDLKRLQDLQNMLLKWRLLSRGWKLPDLEVSMRGRLKELWKPLLQITHGLTVYKTLVDFVKEQKGERLATKQNTLEGHIVKVITEIHNKAKTPIEEVPFQDIWQELAYDLNGVIDEKKPHIMDTAEFFRVTKNKVGYRLREVLSGKSETIRKKISDKDWIFFKAYIFDPEKLRRVAQKYGYELVTKLPSLLSSEGVKAPISLQKQLENGENNVDFKGLESEKTVYAPQELSKLSNLVTKENSLKKKGYLKPSLQLLEELRTYFEREGDSEKGTQRHFELLAMFLGGLTRQEAETLFNQLVDEGKLAMDPEGYWRWTLPTQLEKVEYPDSFNDDALKKLKESVKAARLFNTTEFEKKGKEE